MRVVKVNVWRRQSQRKEFKKKSSSVSKVAGKSKRMWVKGRPWNLSQIVRPWP